MRLLALMASLVLGTAGAWTIRHRRRRRAAARWRASADARHASILDVLPGAMTADPTDPLQSFDEAAELRGDPLDFDARSSVDAEAEQDLAALESELDEAAFDPDPRAPAAFDEIETPRPRQDAGDLYGAHTPPAVDRTHPEDDRAFEEGETWLEALQTDSVEYGAEAEHEIDVTDTADDAPHPSDTRDVPVADKGSGGMRGV